MLPSWTDPYPLAGKMARSLCRIHSVESQNRDVCCQCSGRSQSSEFLRSLGWCCGNLAVVSRLCALATLVLGLEGACAPTQTGFSASLTKAVSSPAGLDWSRCCVPLTRSLKIAWRVLWVAGGCQLTVRPSYPGAAQTGRARSML